MRVIPFLAMRFLKVCWKGTSKGQFASQKISERSPTEVSML